MKHALLVVYSILITTLLIAAGFAVRPTAAQIDRAHTCPFCSLPRTWSENFDNVVPPAVPAGWLATNALGPPPLWATSNTGVPTPPADTPPNAAFIDDPAVLSDKRLDSPSIFFAEACCAQLTFRHNFNLEASDIDPTVGFDGGVLEISTDGGNTFQDIIAAGGGFVMGGYSRTISANRGSPIAGRQAWSGNSDGFITTVVNLPFVGTAATLRWRMASDTSGSNEGWRVDTVDISWCELVPCPTPTALPRRTPRPRPTPAPRPSLKTASDQSKKPLSSLRGFDLVPKGGRCAILDEAASG